MVRALIGSVFVMGAMALAPLAAAHDFTLGKITIDHPTISPAAATRPATAGYMTLMNNGPADKLIAAASPAAKVVEIHTHAKDQSGMMRMRKVEGGVAVPRGRKVAFKPGGLHLMFIGLNKAVAEGDAVEVTLTFEKAGKVTVMAMGEKPAAHGGGHAH